MVNHTQKLNVDIVFVKIVFNKWLSIKIIIHNTLAYNAQYVGVNFGIMKLREKFITYLI